MVVFCISDANRFMCSQIHYRLGIALGSKKYYDFSNEDNWDTKIQSLLKGKNLFFSYLLLTKIIDITNSGHIKSVLRRSAQNFPVVVDLRGSGSSQIPPTMSNLKRKVWTNEGIVSLILRLIFTHLTKSCIIGWTKKELSSTFPSSSNTMCLSKLY